LRGDIDEGRRKEHEGAGEIDVERLNLHRALHARLGRAPEFTGSSARLDQGYTGEEPAAQAASHRVRLEVVKLEEAKRGFVLLPRRWVVERSFGWAARFRRLARDYERLPASLAGLHWLAFAGLMLSSLLNQSA
jgi:transposase